MVDEGGGYFSIFCEGLVVESNGLVGGDGREFSEEFSEDGEHLGGVEFVGAGLHSVSPFLSKSV